MADVITRLKLESSEYDSKIQRAVSGLKRMEEECRNVGGTLAVLEKDQKDYVQSLGQMQTVSNSVRGKISELSNAYMELRSQYNRLTEEEKKGDFGKALSSSLDQLKTRIDESKAELAGINSELNNTGAKSQEAGGMLDQLAQKFTINVDAIKLFQLGLKAANVALDVAKDAFFASETNVDTWGRTVASAQGVYESFLQTLNNGDFSGFFSGIDSVINKAKEAYNAMDELQTRMTIINPERAKLQRDQQKYRAIIRRKGKDSEEGKAASEALKALEPQLEEAYKVEAGLNYNAFQKEVDRKLATAGIKLRKPSYDLLMRSFSSDEAYQKLRAGASGRAGHMEGGENGAASQRWVADSRNTNQKLLDLFTDEWRKQYSPYLTATYNAQGQAYGVQLQNSRYLKEGGGGGGSSTAKAAAVTTKLTEEEKEAARQAKALAEAQRKRAEQINKLNEEGVDAVRNNNLGQAIKVRSQAITAGYEGDTSIPVAFTYSQDNMSALMSMLKSDISASEIGSDMFNALTAQLNDANALSNLITYAMKGGIEASDLKEVSNALFQQLLGEGEIPDEALEAFKNAIGDSLGTALELGGDGSLKEGKKDDNKAWEGFQKSIGNLSTAMSGLTTVTSGLQALGIKIDGDFANFLAGLQGAISVVQGVISIINALSVPSETANTIATNLNSTAIAAMTTALHSNTFSRWVKPWAQGGLVHAADGFMIPGNNMSGDLVPAMVNSGELIPNRAQQGNLAAQLQGGGMQNLHLEGIIAGEDIRLVLKNGALRRNESEYLNFSFS